MAGCADDLAGPDAATLSPALSDASGKFQLDATLTGAAETPDPGDPDGSGVGIVRINQGEVCFQLDVQNIAPATAAHIHEGVAGVAGPAVVTLTAPTSGSSRGCINGLDPNLVKDLKKNPANYYINVHNADYPGGALRDQLRR